MLVGLRPGLVGVQVLRPVLIDERVDQGVGGDCIQILFRFDLLALEDT